MNTPDIYADEPKITVAYMAAVMKAASEGQTIHWRLGELQFCSPWRVLANHHLPSVWNWKRYTYRVAPVPEPKKTVPMERDDYPPFFWIQCKGQSSANFILSMDQYGIAIANSGFMMGGNVTGGVNNYEYKALAEHFEYSTDRKTWLPCTKEVVA